MVKSGRGIFLWERHIFVGEAVDRKNLMMMIQKVDDDDDCYVTSNLSFG